MDVEKGKVHEVRKTKVNDMEGCRVGNAQRAEHNTKASGDALEI